MSKKINVQSSARNANAAVAEANRRTFDEAGVFVLNFISSPGSGKTSILEHTATHFRDARLGVIVGDVKTALDAERILGRDVPAVAIETGGGCHLSAPMIRDALKNIDLGSLDILVIENVGNLVCPSTFDLGEHVKVGVLSVPEGDEKVRKYPALFVRTDAVFIHKVDLLPHCPYDVARVREDLRRARPDVTIFETSTVTGQGFDAWFDYLRAARSA